MDKEMKTLAWQQYVKYFRIWFLISAVLLVITISAVAVKTIAANRPRSNSVSPTERVYDFADVLTPKEEEDLRQFIAKCEKQGSADIIIVTINQPMGLSDYEWETNMMNFADDFYDEAKYGWNKPHGDGSLILDNWYEDENGSQKGTWLSTSGKMEDTIGTREENVVLDAMYDYIDTNPYEAYRRAAAKLSDYGKNGYSGGNSDVSFLCGSWFLPMVVAFIYMIVNLSSSKAKDTTRANTYVVGGKPNVRERSDDFLRKNVTHRRIESSSSSGGGSRSSHSGGGSHGSHRSSGGHSHGGGGRRR